MASPSLPEAFPFDASTPVVAVMNALMAALEARFTPLEAQTNNWNAQLAALQAAAAQQVADTLLPLYQSTLGILQAGSLFSTTSLTTASIRLGQVTFIVSPADAGTYSPPAYIAAVPVDQPDYLLSGKFVGIDRSTGAVTFNATLAIGEGQFATWTLAPGSPVIVPPRLDPGFYDEPPIAPNGPFVQFGDVSGESPIGTY